MESKECEHDSTGVLHGRACRREHESRDMLHGKHMVRACALFPGTCNSWRLDFNAGYTMAVAIIAGGVQE
eukprot:1154210-Pelagomonas_calceolata.AAC.5